MMKRKGILWWWGGAHFKRSSGRCSLENAHTLRELGAIHRKEMFCAAHVLGGHCAFYIWLRFTPCADDQYEFLRADVIGLKTPIVSIQMLFFFPMLSHFQCDDTHNTLYPLSFHCLIRWLYPEI